MLDFKLMFTNANESGLIDTWPSMKDIPYLRFGVRLDKSKYTVMRKDDDIFKLFMYLHLLPTPRYGFDKAVKNLLVFTEDPNADVMIVRNKKLNNPYIIGIFSIATNTVAYFIDVQSGVIPVRMR